jgi:hypothetical protein
MESGPGAGPIGMILLGKLELREMKLSIGSQRGEVGYDYFETDNVVI